MLTVNQLYGFGGKRSVSGNDPSFSSVLFLSGFEGTDASTSFVDESNSARVITATGNAQIDTAQFKFGVSSYLGDGTGDFISVPDSADWNFAGQFTIECFLRYPSNRAAQVPYGHRTSGAGTNSWWSSFTGNGASSACGFFWSTTGSTDTSSIQSGTITTAANTWIHFAVDRDASDKIRVYVDGVMVASATVSGAPFNGTSALAIGAWADAAGSWNGWIDEFRITGGVGRYASDGGFTPPAAAFPRS